MLALHHGTSGNIRASTRLPVMAEEWENEGSPSIMEVFLVERGLLAELTTSCAQRSEASRIARLSDRNSLFVATVGGSIELGSFDKIASSI